MVWPGEGLMVVGVIVGLEIAVVISGLVFTLVGDAWMLEIMELVSDAKGGFSVPPVWMPGLLATGWVPIVSLFPVAGRAVLLSLGSPTGIPIAGVVVPVFPVDEGGNARLPVAVLVEIFYLLEIGGLGKGEEVFFLYFYIEEGWVFVATKQDNEIIS